MAVDVLGNLSFRRLAHFVAVAEMGTISGAAERLFMSQSAVSGSIAELERALGADLLIRHRGRGVSLTPTGTEVLAKARALLDEAAELNYLARGRGTDLVGPLAVGCFVTLAPTVLPRLLAEFEELHPRVTIDFVEGSQDSLQDKLLAGELDVAVMYDMDLTAPLDRIVLYQPTAYALFGEGHSLAAQPTVTLEQLAPEPLILFDTTPSTSYVMSLFEGRGLSPNVRHRTHSYELTRSSVARSATYYAILVQRPPNTASYEGLPIIEREVKPPLPPCPVILAWPRDHRLSPRAHELAKIARRQYGSDATASDPSARPTVGGTHERCLPHRDADCRIAQ
jgi:DNA-binding transcriptional LysR family regulator